MKHEHSGGTQITLYTGCTMSKKYGSAWQKLQQVAASKWLFVGSLVWLALQSLWLILSSNLLPYDEYYHVGIIEFYARQWSPFISQQPAEVSIYGDLTRLPAYLYHYLMSFPYRLLDVITDNHTLIVIGLRILNVAMVLIGIMLFRKLFREAKVSERVINLATLVFVATPIVPLLSAQNNYDNAMFMLTPVVLLLAYRLVTKPTELTTLLWMGTVGMLATLIKYNFIVIFAAVVVYVTWVLVYRHRQRIVGILIGSLQKAPKAGLVAMVVFVLTLGLFTERFGVNAVLYKQVKVDCAKVQPREVCVQYSPWRRNQKALTKTSTGYLYGGAFTYTSHWVSTIMRGYYAIFANIIPENTNIPDPYGNYVFKNLLPLPIALGYSFVALGLLSLLISIKQLWREHLTRLTVVSSTLLVLALWTFNYTFYLKYGRAYAIQARYLIPMMLPLLVLFGQSLAMTVRRTSLGWFKWLLLTMVALYVLSGGIAGWIIKSNDNWYWPHNSLVLNANRTAKAMLKWVVPH